MSSLQTETKEMNIMYTNLFVITQDNFSHDGVAYDYVLPARPFSLAAIF
jgi:hypothetical protein